MNRTDADYLAVDLFQGDESELTCRSVKMVTTRKEHPCHAFADSASCTIPAGARARHERARVDGSFWGSYYSCLPCLDRTIAGDFEDEDEGDIEPSAEYEARSRLSEKQKTES
ncbi:hypothetical protein [Polaromonas naphthalenivorans]|uniref:Uncharacterized protein n=1 Tax=Polaromonas naphthalenivorans (strain CJ2) TaxID=365044 RepID=A1VPL2_POLNA|nr:hypothetical protein [Polaromonas naphthalenivorans]ABM37590.1 hypothetical protein Pnap_2282 [Polaromonas naphthalenivorans CJ2]